jgi:ADP-ribose pyrophosphatase YjhB (NUDIX family)
LSQRSIEGREREVCQQCGWIKYDQLKVTAGVLVERDKKVLLVKRAIQPWRGYWYLPAGFVENDESPREAAEREGFEETNLKISTKELIDVYYYNDDPRGNGLLILYSGIIISGTVNLTPEVQEINFFSRDEIQFLELAGGSHNLAILDWAARKSVDNLKDEAF